MRRREFIAASAALVVSPRHPRAQGNRRRLGFLRVGEATPIAQNAWLDGLRDHGWIDGKNLTIEYRNAESVDRLPALAAELISLTPDLVIAAGPQQAIALKSVTATIPIVFVAVFDPVGLGLVQSLSRPGGNITGLATFAGGDITAKQIQILRELVPGAAKIAILANPNNPMQRLILAEKAPRTARNLGVDLAIVEATTAEELDKAFASATAQHAEAMIVFGDPLTNRQAPRVVALAAKHHLPAIYLFRQFANGGLIVYGPDIADLFRRAGGYVDKILKGTNPSDLPVARPTKYQLVINMKTAKALGLMVPPSLLVRADEVIE